MKTQDLMIGDYIQDLAGDLCQVIVIDRQVAQVETLTGVHQGDTTRYLHEAEGVPLTIEILEKNGFHLMHGFGYSERYPTYGWGDKDGDKYISVDVRFYDDEPNGGVQHLVKINRDSMKDDGVDSIHSCDIDYVHELQHALKLCGIKKDIQL